MSTAIFAKRLKLLLKKLETAVTEKPVRPERTPVHEVIHAFLVWDATLEQAEKAYDALMASVIDINELRVCDPDEIVEIIGPRYPAALKRAHLMKQTLHSIYQREHAVDLSAVAAKPKREARAYLDSLEGIVPHVAASVMLLSLEGHAIPVDSCLLKRLQEDVAVDPYGDEAAAQSFLEHQVRASDGLMVHAQLRAYVEKSIKVSLPKAPVIKKPAPKKEVVVPVEEPVAPVEEKKVEAPAKKGAKKASVAKAAPAKTSKAVAAPKVAKTTKAAKAPKAVKAAKKTTKSSSKPKLRK